MFGSLEEYAVSSAAGLFTSATATSTPAGTTRSAALGLIGGFVLHDRYAAASQHLAMREEIRQLQARLKTLEAKIGKLGLESRSMNQPSGKRKASTAGELSDRHQAPAESGDDVAQLEMHRVDRRWPNRIRWPGTVLDAGPQAESNLQDSAQSWPVRAERVVEPPALPKVNFVP